MNAKVQLAVVALVLGLAATSFGQTKNVPDKPKAQSKPATSGVETLVYGYLLAAAFACCYVAWEAGPGGILAFVCRRCGLQTWGRWFGPTTDLAGLLQRRLPMAPFFACGALAAAWGG